MDMHIHIDPLDGFTFLLIINDLLATRGTVNAPLDLINKFPIKKFQDKQDVVTVFIIKLPKLGGCTKLEKIGCESKYLLEL